MPIGTKVTVANRRGVVVQTTTGATMGAVQFTTRKSKVYFVEVRAVASYADHSKAGTYWKQASFRTDAAGTLTQISATKTVVEDSEDTAGMALDMAVFSPTLVVSITGVADTTIQWHIYTDIMEGDSLPMA